MSKRQSRPWVWIVVAVLLLIGGAWLMRGAEPPSREPTQIRLPTRMTGEEKERANTRRSFMQLPPVDAGALFKRPKDPLLAMMPAQVKYAAVVAEFSAIAHSDLGGLMMECLFTGEEKFMSELQDAGVNLATQLDRVGMVDNALVVTGDFKNAQWKRFLPSNAVSKGYGPRGEIIEVPRSDGGIQTFGVWDGQMFFGGGNEASPKAFIDRLEGNAPDEAPVLDESMAYGEVYGVVSTSAFADLVGRQDSQLGEIVRQSAKSVQLHMDVSHDVGLVADIESSDPSKTEELRKTLGGALSLLRMKAEASGKAEQSAILDLARVHSAEGSGTFRLEAGLPYEYLEAAFHRCIEAKQHRAKPTPLEEN